MTVFGEDRLSGEFPIRPAGTVSLSLAGGLTYRARPSTVLIKRESESGFREYSPDGNVPVLPGHLIKIPQRYF